VDPGLDPCAGGDQEKQIDDSRPQGQTNGDAAVALELNECPIFRFLYVLCLSTHHPAGHAIVSIRSHPPLHAPALTPARPLALSHTHSIALSSSESTPHRHPRL